MQERWPKNTVIAAQVSDVACKTMPGARNMAGMCLVYDLFFGVNTCKQLWVERPAQGG
ncbi:hypothetical protein [Komagataeibacter xylinus]|uniref:hypothetical protein n=1 Tax=Komagataeibacter xylinus TaxID=28448 RepID=UPI000B0D604D|nr:hypothetical protein [Komagataeibacter xylinus]